MAWDRPRKPAFTPADRRTILRRDRVCVACGERKATQADHIRPVAEGGSNDISNGQGLCGPCHEAKSLAESKRGYRRWNTDRRPRQYRRPEAHPGVID